MAADLWAVGCRGAGSEWEGVYQIRCVLVDLSDLFVSLKCSKEKPTLGGQRIKTRKRNIAAPLDPASFSDAIVQIYLDNAGDLELVAKSIESSDLNFSRYGDTFFEVVFIGGRTQPGTIKPEEKEDLPQFRLRCHGQAGPFSPSVFTITKPWPQKPFWLRILEKLRPKSSHSMEVLEGNRGERNCPFQRPLPVFQEVISKEGLTSLVEYNEKKMFEVKLKEIKLTLTTMINEEAEISEVTEAVKQQVKDAKFPDIEVVRMLWDVLMEAVQWSGKNQQQNSNSALRQVKAWAGLLNAFCTSGRLELELIYKVQTQCYEDAKLMKLFPEIIRTLYDQDVLAEDTILLWFRKGSNPKGRQSFVKALEPFVKWLEEAEEEE
ncbi:hypothetical protein OsI_30699 [Oryza sativa Indica Group]|uniref:W2 domain-containing protein n=1 Tax=Oryza sativa subsp. indica TaxID=39946 RepID=B8BDR3_ORYSI|nr:hypothetical protein OsI_30699 [Oryza sativa Indica Group]